MTGPTADIGGGPDVTGPGFGGGKSTVGYRDPAALLGWLVPWYP